ncbi:MAG: carbamoyl-phosphate synthase large subunit [Desulfuromonadales bacterium]|jgi:carbamoyl-phosphate synthase large subunit|nr:carbamoyl-phosphate synthase large subunit [Desulfuromonadales bacterium]
MTSSNRKINVLLTGAGGDQSVFIWKALKQSTFDINIIACDSNYLSVGLYRTDRGYVVPEATSQDFLPRLKEIIVSENVDIIMTGGMAEMMVLAENAGEIREETKAYVVCPPFETLKIAGDKWSLVNFLKSNGFSYPASCIPENREVFQRFLDEVPFPYIVKGRYGAGSRELTIAHDKAELEQSLLHLDAPIIQEYLMPDDEEYTVGCFCNSQSKAVGSIIMKRTLGHGLTHKASVIFHDGISAYCESIAEKLGYIGPLNLQLRLTERGPVLFEINPRFSSTESARAYFNFNMPEMCIRHFVLHEEVAPPKVKTGYFFRVFDDVFVDEGAVEETKITGVSKGISAELVRNF